MLSFIEVVGLTTTIVGTVIPYLLLNMNKISLRSFNAVILASSIVLGVYGYVLNLPTVIVINVFWGSVAIYALLKKAKVTEKQN